MTGKKQRLPEDWRPTLEQWERARERLSCDPQEEFEAFQDYHLGRGTTMLDWGRAWSTWTRNAVRFAARARPRDNSPIVQETRAAEPETPEYYTERGMHVPMRLQRGWRY